MRLGEKQKLFTMLVSALIEEIDFRGYACTFGDAYRSPKVKYGHPNSLHRKRLAIDLNLFRDGKYLTSTKSHKLFGEWWEKQHELCRWGGRFSDGNHYSIAHGGMK